MMYYSTPYFQFSTHVIIHDKATFFFLPLIVISKIHSFEYGLVFPLPLPPIFIMLAMLYLVQ